MDKYLIDPKSVPGWGIDADPDNDPTYPMKPNRTDVEQQGYSEETEYVIEKLLRQYRQYHARFEVAEFSGVIQSMERLRQALAAEATSAA